MTPFLRATKVSLLALALAATHAGAQQIACSGNLKFLGIDGAGNVTIQLQLQTGGSGDTEIHRICNITPQFAYPSMSAQSCQAAHAMLTQARGSRVQVFYKGLASCAAIGYWATTDTYFVGLL